MKITLLGTGTSQGIPVIACDCEVCHSVDARDKRLRSSVMIETEDFRVVIDAGPDVRQQMLTYRVKTLNALLLTHAHADHIFGLDDIRSFNWFQSSPMDIYCEKRVADNLRTIFNYAFAENKYPGTPSMNLLQLDGSLLSLGPFQIIPVRLYHHKLPVYGFRFGKFAYLTDFNRIEPEELAKLQGVEVLVICALMIKSHISHLSLSEALSLIEQIAPVKAYLTHMSHGIGKHVDLLSKLPKGVEPGFDGLEIMVE